MSRENCPLRADADGSVESVVVSRRMRPVSASPKKNVLLRTIGKPDGAAELMPRVGGLRRREVVGRVERVVTEELVETAVQAVRARLERDADDAGRGAAVFGRVAVGDDLELLDRVDRRLDDLLLPRVAGRDLLAVVVVTVEQERDGRAGLPADDDALAAGRPGTGGQRGQLQVVASVERQRGDLLVGDDRADGRIRRVQRRRRRVDGDRLGERSDLQRHVDVAHVADVEDDARAARTCGSRRAGRASSYSPIRSGGVRYCPRCVGDDVDGGVGRDVGGGDGRARKLPAGTVADDPDEDARYWPAAPCSAGGEIAESRTMRVTPSETCGFLRVNEISCHAPRALRRTKKKARKR